ncbi:glycosyl transferase family 2 [candidate division KSB3 bacterium]|uniref:Glycosyl transferase family 2 n=1 Tax=candidate division KSB3 bacterium TaxID=2044937 RepID=A0A2G6KAT4_9BACT|nr:MAG: glycosyl transferase family 2 [candidate division KSB3 bacterium]
MNEPEVTLTTPTVSILLPNLNNRDFLEERLRTIVEQTYADWELIVIDGYSDDGAWELIGEFAARDPRFRISQAPPKGVYAALNRAIQLARGEYVYLAMSDDTMTLDCLDRMVSALEAYPDCEVCHCCLQIIDETGNELEDWRQFESVRFYGERINRLHVRKAPLDGILHCALYMMYCSLTQLLLRRSIFQKVGLFPTSHGSIGDFEWNMRVGLACNILHVPETLATWRRHSTQATDAAFLHSANFHARLCEMITATLPMLALYEPALYKRIRLSRLLLPYRQRQCIIGMGEQQGWKQKITYLLRFMLISPRCSIDFILNRFQGKLRYLDNIAYIQQELERLNLDIEDYVELC